MASIERTAYPYLKQKLTEKELKQLYQPNDEELKFVRHHSKGSQQQLTLLVQLKAYQQIGYVPSSKDVPKQIQKYLTGWLGLSNNISILEENLSNKKSFYRYRQAIRAFLNTCSWSNGGNELAKKAVKKAAYTMSDPADLINVAIEVLSKNRYELPAFSTLKRLVGNVRQQVHEHLYQQITIGLSDKQRHILDELIEVKVNKRLTDFNEIKQFPGKSTLKQMKAWADRLGWLCEIIVAEEFIQNIPHTKVRQFAAEASVLETGDMKDIHNAPKRYALLLCFLHQAQVQTRDELVMMFLKRMKQTHNRAKEKLKILQEKYRNIEEQMLSMFSDVVSLSTNELNDAQLGKQLRVLLDDHGGVKRLKEQYKKVSEYHNNNHLPLLWNIHRQHRKAIFRLLNLLDIQTATQDESLLKALHFLKEYQHTRRDYLPYEIDLEFISQRWKGFVQFKEDGQTILKRRELEVCILFYIANGLKCGDLYISGSEDFSDYRKQLLSWEECQQCLLTYCQDLQLPENENDFVTHLKEKLTQTALKLDNSYPENTELTIEDNGKPHLKRIKATPEPEGLEKFKETVRERMPEHHLLDVLKNVQHWVNYTRHFKPLSGSDPKMADAIARYLFTVFGYGCNLGASQTARHTQERITLRILNRINDQHITTENLEAALRDIINEYTRFDLPFLWGSSKTAIADGTHVELIENNLLGERHIRYGSYGGLAYHHISDTYIALFTHFIACGVWEAVYILDGLLKNTSKLQPDTIHGDTQGQSEPVFGLAYLLGIRLMPRMRNWNDVTFYRPQEDTTYKHIDLLFTQTANWQLIRTHWKDLMQVVLSIRAGKVLPSMLLQKLGVHSRKNKLYQAFRELGRVVRTIFLLDYIGSEPMRKEIRAATTKVESFHNFRAWVSFGDHIITSGDPVEQEKRIKYINLVANAIILHNVVDLTKALDQMILEGYKISPQLAERLSPYMTEHIKRFGQYILDMDTIPEPLEPPKLILI